MSSKLPSCCRPKTIGKNERVSFNDKVYNIVPHPPRSWEGGAFACTVQLAKQKTLLDLSYEAMGDAMSLDENDEDIAGLVVQFSNKSVNLSSDHDFIATSNLPPTSVS